MSVSRRVFTFGLSSLPLLQGKTTPPQSSTSAAVTSPSPSPIGVELRLFDSHEWETVAAIAETIIPATDTPGAREARVAEYLDLILSDSPESVRAAFLEGLWWTDAYARRSVGAPFKDLGAADQIHLISALHDSENEDERTGHQFVHSIKIWTARIYYSTEIGQQELNRGGRVPAAYFGHCEPERA